MKRYEIESLTKSFVLFFVLIASIYALFIWQNYTGQKHRLDARILQEMKLFTFDPTTDQFSVDFVPPQQQENRYILHHTKDAVYGLFTVPTVDDFLMKVSLPEDLYTARLHQIFFSERKLIILYLFLIGLISFLLAYYSLRPIRQALQLNKEFMKDIMHDINTPVASIAVNVKLLKKYFGKHKALDRIDTNIKTIGLLNQNAHAYLGDEQEEDSKIILHTLVDERIDYFAALYPDISFHNNLPPSLILHTKKSMLTRILDNIIGNAAKYNASQGSVMVDLDLATLIVSDTGRGIRDVRQVFKRHFKEGERGTGLGLHIVKKLCAALQLDVSLQSKPNAGTKVYIDCTKVIVK